VRNGKGKLIRRCHWQIDPFNIKGYKFALSIAQTTQEEHPVFIFPIFQ